MDFRSVQQNQDGNGEDEGYGWYNMSHRISARFCDVKFVAILLSTRDTFIQIRQDCFTGK